jgi:hypothetical protein
MSRFAEWVQAAGAVGVLVGIVLVLLQLQQNEQLVRFQIATELRINRDNDRNITRGESYSSTPAKLQRAPEELTDAELGEFSAHASSLFY